MLADTMLRNPHSQAPLATVLEKLRRAAQQDFDQAHPIPPEVNHSLAFHEHEQQAVFQQEWICVGREDEIPASGDFLTHEIASVPVLVVRQADNNIRAFVNACAHRFACLVPDSSGSVKHFTCRYHAWSYDCGGELLRDQPMMLAPITNTMPSATKRTKVIARCFVVVLSSCSELMLRSLCRI